MIRQALLILSCLAALFSMRLLYANEAPVVDVTQQAQTQAAQPEGAPVDSSVSGDESQTPMVNSVTPAETPPENEVVQNPPAANMPPANSKRVHRLELQVADLQQRVDKLQAQVQLQQHSLEILQQGKNTPEPNHVVKADNAPVKAAPTVAVKKTLDEATAYRNAFDALIKKQYDQARSGFENYLTQFPKGQFLVNAHYWLGEIYLLQKKSDLALAQFQAVVDQFPNSSKVSDAKLKIAQILAQTGKIPQARQQLITIIKKYPGSTAAQLAKIQLQQISPAKKTREDD